MTENHDLPDTPELDEAETKSGHPRRAIRSFVMRAGRMTDAQKRGIDLGWPRFGLNLENGLLNLDALFGREAPRTLEIGFGMGQSLLEMAQCIPDASLDRVLLFFPDPWHKKKHNKRRIVQLAFAEQLRSKLKIGGVFHMATDWEAYAEHMLEVMSVAPGYRNLAEDGTYVPRPEERPITKFERRGERLGHGVWDLKFERVE